MKNYREKEVTGSITVFLSLILILILSLLLTLIEGARVSTAKVFAERSLTTSMDSVLAEYYGPLWEEYHIFGYDIGNGTMKEQNDMITSKMKDYMSYSINTYQGLESKLSVKGVDLYHISVEDISIPDQTMIMDHQGKLFINEAVEYMKYNELGKGLENLLSKISLLESSKKVSMVYEKKQKVEEELVEIDEGILELMELLDGIKTSKKGIETGRNGSVHIADYFIKKICLDEVTKSSVGINQESIFLALRDHYTNPMVSINSINEMFNSLNEVFRNIESCQKAYKTLTISLSEAQQALNKLSQMKETKLIKKQKAEINGSISNIMSQLEKISDQIKKQESAKEQIITNIITIKSGLTQSLNEILPLINRALLVIDNIIRKSEKAEPLIRGYEEFLNSEKENMEEGIYNDLLEDLKEIKRYIASDNSGYNFSIMKQVLTKDIAVITQTISLLDQGSLQLVQKQYQSAEGSFENAGKEISKYQIQGLTLDYSSLVLDKKEKLDPLGKIEDIIESGITGMVIDPNSISKAKISTSPLPSEMAALSEEKKNTIDQLTSFFRNSIIGGQNNGMGTLFECFGSNSDIKSVIESRLNTVAEKVLFQEYLKKHFEIFPKKGEDISGRKPSILTYELEYLIEGDRSDKENLSDVISQIIFLRTIMDFVSILGDKARCSEAELAAASLVGFTGLPILVSITKTLILLIWAFDEALVDACALILGRNVPMLKKEIVLQFPELFMINRTLIEQKAAAFSQTKGLELSYNDYLTVFLFMKSNKNLVYRAMDLIQENIKLRYDVPFQIQNCLYGYNSSAEYLISPKFTSISFVKRLIGGSVDGFRFKAEGSYSY